MKHNNELEGKTMRAIRSICVNCGSSSGLLPEYIEGARELGRLMAREKIDLVFGGAEVGLMGAVADAVIESGGKAIGVIPSSLADKVGHGKLTELHVVESMHQRKMKMFELSDAFIALPGGMGTVEEIVEILTWSQLGFHDKPGGLLNMGGYYDRLLAFFDHAVEHRFVKAVHRDMILVSNSFPGLLKRLREYRAPVEEKWIDRKGGRQKVSTWGMLDQSVNQSLNWNVFASFRSSKAWSNS
jgi:uncharacterized protein (TIGR00730 family)